MTKAAAYSNYKKNHARLPEATQLTAQPRLNFLNLIKPALAGSFKENRL